VASLTQFVQLQQRNNLVDAALAQLDVGTYWAPTYNGQPVSGVSDPVQGAPVWKVGRTTGVTVGTIGSARLRFVAVDFAFGTLFFDDVFEVTGDNGQPFSIGGDSGSLVLNASNEAVGLLFAGADPSPQLPTGRTFCVPIRTVLDTFQVGLLS